MSYVYIYSRDDRLWTVGFYKPNGTWEPESDHRLPEEAAKRVNYLNGGTDTNAVMAAAMYLKD